MAAPAAASATTTIAAAAGTPFWHALLPEGRPLRVNEDRAPPTRAHAVIVGCGMTGLACARALARGLPAGSGPVVALDARGVADGATGRNGGHQFAEVAEEGAHGAELLCAKIEAHDVATVNGFIDGLTEAHKTRIGHAQTGGLSLCLDEEQEPFLRDHAEKTGAKFLSKNDILERELVRCDEAVCGVEYAQPSQMCPGGILVALLEEVQACGVFVRTSSKVVKVSPSSDAADGAAENAAEDAAEDAPRWVVETADGAQIACRYVIHASNGYGTDLLPARLQAVLQPTRGQVIAAKLPKGTAMDSVLYSCEPASNEEYLLQRRQDGVVIFGGCRHLSENKGLDSDDQRVEEHVTDRLTKELGRLFHGVQAEVINAWCGIMCFSRDRQPIVGPIKELPGQFLSVGYTGHGMVRSFSCGQHVAEQVLGTVISCPEIDEMFSPDRFAQTDSA